MQLKHHCSVWNHLSCWINLCFLSDESKMQSGCLVSADSRKGFQSKAHFLQLPQQHTLRRIKAEAQETPSSPLMVDRAQRKPSLQPALSMRPWTTQGQSERSGKAAAALADGEERLEDTRRRRLLTLCQTRSGLCRSALHLELKEMEWRSLHTGNIHERWSELRFIRINLSHDFMCTNTAQHWNKSGIKPFTD